MSTAVAARASGVSHPAAAHRPLLDRMRRFWRTPKGLLTLVFVPLLLVAGQAQGWGRALPHVTAAVTGACLADVMLARWMRQTWVWPSGALLSGVIVAFVLGTETAGLVTFTIAAIASASKHAIRLHRVHVFNPAGLALLLAVPVFATGQSWWGALPDLPWPWLVLLAAGGAIVLDRLNKFPLALTFTGTLFGLFTLAGMAGIGDPAHLSEMFHATFVQATLFLALFMLSDPPTSPTHAADQVWIGALAAVVAAGAQLLGFGQVYLLIGLLAANIALAARRWLVV